MEHTRQLGGSLKNFDKTVDSKLEYSLKSDSVFVSKNFEYYN
jgi:hypothetical protein